MVALSQHAARRMAERRIAMAWIEAAIAAPDWTVPDDDPALTRSFRAVPEAGGRILKGVHRPEDDDILPATVHLDREARP